MTGVPTRPRPWAAGGFYGWHIVVWSCIALAMTGPGQTAGVSVFIDPLIADLGLNRSTISTAYLLGTVGGAVAMPFVGRAIDRFGVRWTMTVIAIVYGTVLCSLAGVSSLVGLTAGFVGLRMASQGALQLAATTAVALWFSRRRGTAVGIVSGIGMMGISLTPVIVEGLIEATTWRVAWLAEGLAVWAVVLPIAVFAMRDRPEALGQHVDGQAPDADGPRREHWGVGRAQAMRTGFFWVACIAVAVSGLLVTAVNFHQISLLGEQGLDTAQAAGNFLPQTVASLAATFGVGALADRVASRWLIVASMLGLAAALLCGVIVRPGWSAVVFGLLLGAALGSIRSVEAATFPRHFGVAHVGEIRGTVAAVSVGSTAFGPLLFASIHDLEASYVPALLVTAPIPVLVAVAALVVRPPTFPDRVAGETENPVDTGTGEDAGPGPAEVDMEAGTERRTEDQPTASVPRN
ncbi:MFS transporter [Longimycelium tulufanense]|uniref:MFS transporter n=1 Tax=Longimycelium tulufanense TaxID=907463 RepID=A0A8J3C7R2_9PSEU|nr:MFS transporter [Longimycelium tulufanense]GGM50195.1 MFS transporter [Longimycelium tulufanense]